MLRKLRIAATALGLTACLLLLGLWVRSYWQNDAIVAAVSSSSFYGVGSIQGTVVAYRGDNAPGYFAGHFEINSYPIAGGRVQGPEVSPRYRGRFGFGIAQDPTFILLCSPHWFVVAVFGALAALPWVKPPRRFSLRTLLIGISVVAVLLAIIVALT